MSRSKRGGKSPGYEWWNRRPGAGDTPNAKNKKIVHKIERAQARQDLYRKAQQDDVSD